MRREYHLARLERGTLKVLVAPPEGEDPIADVGDLAAALWVDEAEAQDAVERLRELGLVQHERLLVTPEGRQLARSWSLASRINRAVAAWPSMLIVALVGAAVKVALR